MIREASRSILLYDLRTHRSFAGFEDVLQARSHCDLPMGKSSAVEKEAEVEEEEVVRGRVPCLKPR